MSLLSVETAGITQKNGELLTNPNTKSRNRTPLPDRKITRIVVTQVYQRVDCHNDLSQRVTHSCFVHGGGANSVLTVTKSYT